MDENEIVESDVPVEESTDSNLNHNNLDPEDNTEVLENQEETEDENIIESVSGGDSFSGSGSDQELLEEIKLLLEANNDMIFEYQQEQQCSIWEKDINDYTPTEGMLLIILSFVVVYFLYRIIGGILHVSGNE